MYPCTLLRLKEGDVVDGDEEEEAGEDDEADDLDGGLDFEGEGFTADFFEDEEEEETAVDDGEREEVGDGEVDGDEGEDVPEPDGAAFLGVVADLGDADDSVEVGG